MRKSSVVAVLCLAGSVPGCFTGHTFREAGQADSEGEHALLPALACEPWRRSSRLAVVSLDPCG